MARGSQTQTVMGGHTGNHKEVSRFNGESGEPDNTANLLHPVVTRTLGHIARSSETSRDARKQSGPL